MYPTLKEVALAGASGSKAMKQVAQQILGVAIQAAGEGKVYVVDWQFGISICLGLPGFW